MILFLKAFSYIQWTKGPGVILFLAKVIEENFIQNFICICIHLVPLSNNIFFYWMIDKYLNQYWSDSNLNHCYWNDMRSDRVFKFCVDTPIDIKNFFLFISEMKTTET